LDEGEAKIDLCGLDSCRDEDEDDNKSDLGVKHEYRRFEESGCDGRHVDEAKVRNLYLKQQVKETGKGSNSICSHIHQNNTNNLNSKRFSEENEVDMDRQVRSGSDLKFKRIPPRRNQSDEHWQDKHHLNHHNLAVQIKSTPMSRNSGEGAEVHVEDSTRRRARPSMTAHPNGVQAESENNGSESLFCQSGLRCGASSTAAVPHNLIKPVGSITSDKARTLSPAGAAETVLVPSRSRERLVKTKCLQEQVSDPSWQADALGWSVATCQSSRLFGEEVHQHSLPRIVPVRAKDLANYVRKLDDKTIDARRAQIRQTILHCQSKLLGVDML
jgi:hypothetical protein